MDNYDNYYGNQSQSNTTANYQNQTNQNAMQGAIPVSPANFNQIAPQQNTAQQFPHPAVQSQNTPQSIGEPTTSANETFSFQDPNSFVPQSLRSFNTYGKYFTTRGRDKLGQETKFYFTQEERDYLTKFGISAQEFYNQYQSKLGGEFVKGDPTRSPAFVGPTYQDPSSFVPTDMRKHCPDRNYFKYVIRDEVGLQKEVYLTQEEIDFTRMASIDISTYVNVYQKEFDYDKGQMERETSKPAVQMPQNTTATQYASAEATAQINVHNNLAS